MKMKRMRTKTPTKRIEMRTTPKMTTTTMMMTTMMMTETTITIVMAKKTGQILLPRGHPPARKTQGKISTTQTATETTLNPVHDHPCPMFNPVTPPTG
jgi:hypothetical protein